MKQNKNKKIRKEESIITANGQGKQTCPFQDRINTVYKKHSWFVNKCLSMCMGRGVQNGDFFFVASALNVCLLVWTVLVLWSRCAPSCPRLEHLFLCCLEQSGSLQEDLQIKIRGARNKGMKKEQHQSKPIRFRNFWLKLKHVKHSIF